MSSAYTDEQLYLHYRPTAASDAAAIAMVAEHRVRYADDQINTAVGVWADTTVMERRAGVLQAMRRASLLPAGPERNGLIAHALRGALAGV